MTAVGEAGGHVGDLRVEDREGNRRHAALVIHIRHPDRLRRIFEPLADRPEVDTITWH